MLAAFLSKMVAPCKLASFVHLTRTGVMRNTEVSAFRAPLRWDSRTLADFTFPIERSQDSPLSEPAAIQASWLSDVWAEYPEIAV